MSYGARYPDLFRRDYVDFCAARSRPTSRSSSRPSSTSSLIWRPPRHLALACRRRCSPAPMRWSNDPSDKGTRNHHAARRRCDMAARGAGV